MHTLTLKNGEVLTIREAQSTDAQSIIDHKVLVGDETDFLTFSGSEVSSELSLELDKIDRYAKSYNQIYLVSFIGEQLVGVSDISSSYKPRLRHLGELGISVIKEHWGKGIGKTILQYMIDWSYQSGVIRKLNLFVQLENTRAIQIYEQLGFEKEGIQKRALFVNNTFEDGMHMGLLIDNYTE